MHGVEQAFEMIRNMLLPHKGVLCMALYDIPTNGYASSNAENWFIGRNKGIPV